MVNISLKEYTLANMGDWRCLPMGDKSPKKKEQKKKKKTDEKKSIAPKSVVPSKTKK